MTIVDVNEKLMGLAQATGYPVAPDLYSGKSSKFIVFTYDDERAVMWADDDEEYLEASIKISFYCPQNFNYMPDKKKIKKELMRMGFQVENIFSYLESNLTGVEYMRHTVFNTNITIKVEE